MSCDKQDKRQLLFVYSAFKQLKVLELGRGGKEQDTQVDGSSDKWALFNVICSFGFDHNHQGGCFFIWANEVPRNGCNGTRFASSWEQSRLKYRYFGAAHHTVARRIYVFKKTTRRSFGVHKQLEITNANKFGEN